MDQVETAVGWCVSREPAPKIHTLANGATVITLSPHAFRFSDGTVSEPQHKEICEAFTLRRSFATVGNIKGMKINTVRMELGDLQLLALQELSQMADIILVPFPFLTAMREQRVRDWLKNVVCFNATQETQRSAPDAKVVDIDNWSY
jgi:hypothetical protein